MRVFSKTDSNIKFGNGLAFVYCHPGSGTAGLRLENQVSFSSVNTCWYCGEVVLEENSVSIKAQDGDITLHWECFFLIGRELERPPPHLYEKGIYLK